MKLIEQTTPPYRHDVSTFDVFRFLTSIKTVSKEDADVKEHAQAIRLPYASLLLDRELSGYGNVDVDGIDKLVRDDSVVAEVERLERKYISSLAIEQFSKSA